MHDKQTLLTYEHLVSILIYDRYTGYFSWRHSRKGVKRSSELYAGTRALTGYIQIMIAKRLYLAHRLAWFYETVRWPDLQIDHINGIRSDNRICNLREANQSQQSANSAMQANNSTGLKGVAFSAGKYIAQITHNGVYYYLGRFPNPEDAHAAYMEAALRLHGKFARRVIRAGE